MDRCSYEKKSDKRINVDKSQSILGCAIHIAAVVKTQEHTCTHTNWILAWSLPLPTEKLCITLLGRFFWVCFLVSHTPSFQLYKSLFHFSGSVLTCNTFHVPWWHSVSDSGLQVHSVRLTHSFSFFSSVSNKRPSVTFGSYNGQLSVNLRRSALW